MTKTINPFSDLPVVAPAAPAAETATTAPVEETATIRPNKLETTNRCPVDGRPMQRVMCGVKGTDTETHAYACLEHRVCLPVPNSEL